MTTYTGIASLGFNAGEVTKTDVAAVMQGRINPMRDMDKSVLHPNLSLTIKHVANLYGARSAVDEVTLQECMDLVIQEFSMLSLVEIIQAYRLWAAQKFEALEMYGGQFNVTQLARVLSGYKKYRFEINQALAREKNKDEAEAEEERKAARRAIEKEMELKAFPAAVANAKATGRFPLPKNIPIRWYKLAEHYGMIEFEPGEKLEFCKRAEKILLAERTAKARAKDFVSFGSLGITNEKRLAVSSYNRAQQMIVFEKVLNREMPLPEVKKPEPSRSGPLYNILEDPAYFVQPEIEKQP